MFFLHPVVKTPTKEIWVKLIDIIHNIITLGTPVAILKTPADALETARK